MSDHIVIIVNMILNVAMLGLGVYLIYLFRSIIVPVFRVDPEVSLRSILESLEEAARIAAKVGKDLEINVAEARQQFSRLVVLLDHLQTSADLATATSERMEAEDRQVAQRLMESQRTARGLDPESPPGTAADSAASGPEDSCGS